jgi:hypothetical protein
MGYYASTNNFQGSFVYGDTSTASTVTASAADQWTIRATGGYRFFSNSALTNGMFIRPNGNVGIGVQVPQSPLHVQGTVRVTGGPVFIAQPNSLIITSPNGNCWFITVGDTGVLSTFTVPCP